MRFVPALRHILPIAALMACLPLSAQDIGEVTADGVKAILKQPGLIIDGAVHPDVTLVEYFDYNCPYCKRVVPTFKQLLAADKGVAIVYKDWPVLGETSKYAARCALAAAWQNKYQAAHDALLSGPRLASNDIVDSVLQTAGVDLGRLKQDLVTHDADIGAGLARNAAEARALNLDGTPGIIVGTYLLPGGADLEFFQKLVAAVRRQSATTH
jgi:protein-disulfide isomerase